MTAGERVLLVGALGLERIASELTGVHDVDRAPDVETARERLAKDDYECVVLPGSIPASDVDRFVRRVASARDATAVVLVGSSPDHDDEVAGHPVPVRYVHGGARLPERLRVAVDRAIRSSTVAADLQRTRTRLEAFFANNPDPAVEYAFEDGDLVIRSVNRAFEEVFGYEREAVVGERLNDVIVPAGMRDEAAMLDERVRDGQQVDAEVTRETADGQREFRFRNIPVGVDDGGSEGYAVYTDIDEQKARERRLHDQNERLNEFAGVVSHDLRSPLEVVTNRIDMARETGDLSHLDDAKDAIDRMDELLRELLSMARQGEAIGRTAPESLADVVETAWSHVATGDASLVVERDARLMADRGRLTELLENLYANAVKHTPEGSKPVTVTVDRVEDGFYVADDGAGIPADERDRVFKSGYTTAADGTGSGLTIVREVARAHGWDVSVTDSDAGGARFEFRGVEFVGP